MFSALLAFLQSTLWDPWRRRNSMESKPRPSDDTNMAELMRLRVQRSEMEVECSSASMWMCCNEK